MLHNFTLVVLDKCYCTVFPQVNGRIIDSAFTVAFNPKFEPLMTAVKEATYAGMNILELHVLMLGEA